MDYLAGVVVAAAIAGLGHLAGFERERSFYPVVMVAIALVYLLLAAVASAPWLALAELAIGAIFAAVAVLGFRYNLWLVVVALVAHGLYDAAHAALLSPAAVPPWYPAFCLAVDLTLGIYLAGLLVTHRVAATAGPAPGGA